MGTIDTLEPYKQCGSCKGSGKELSYIDDYPVKKEKLRFIYDSNKIWINCKQCGGSGKVLK